ncbi:related to Putative transferase CAF17, mitochondrial [Ramularia collo-cygni]|uniref:Iron-sulfur cluster assembly factor IBA57 homolog, mitochondrial n=1 Tax=Ramularia collo-cygni TaxID=112498 RepID=A0A2D3V5F7_9PEZI|nr:related to Putative transferase CAF17, mitochondrial [Ramularia collo-cygni]CZT18776.1 related to Putative transferase CAF17, mitochondrial [Ramularia collo-cygni]
MFARASKAPYICSQCLSKRGINRFYSTESPPSPSSSGAAKLATRRLISVHGVDAPKFLQGIITNNVKTSGPEATKGFYAAFLTAPGKVLHDSFIYPTIGSEWHAQQVGSGVAEEPGYLVEVDSEQVDVLMKHLKRHKLRSKFKLRVVEDGEMNVWSVWREGDRWTAHGTQDGMDGVVGLTDARAPGMGQRLVLPGEGHPMLNDMEQAPLSAYTLRRYLRGVPEGQKEMPRDDCLPMNCNIDIMGGIDFKKGCYLGQELTIRTHHTGVVRRRSLPVALYDLGSEPPEQLESVQSTIDTVLDGADIRRDDKRKRSTGKLIGHVGNIGLGMCRLEQMTDLIISGEPSPFTPEDRFLVQSADGKEMGLKAFVPDWIRGRIRAPKVQKRVQ